jgi:hypothetical protein
VGDDVAMPEHVGAPRRRRSRSRRRRATPAARRPPNGLQRSTFQTIRTVHSARTVPAPWSTRGPRPVRGYSYLMLTFASDAHRQHHLASRSTTATA